MDMSNVATRLESRFGLGTRPDLRRKLYQRLQDAVDNEGEAAYVCIATAAADAEGKEHPGHYFARVVMLRLYERGVLASPAL